MEGRKAELAKLRSTTDDDFEALQREFIEVRGNPLHLLCVATSHDAIRYVRGCVERSSGVGTGHACRTHIWR
jgi:hypothetical protein